MTAIKMSSTLQIHLTAPPHQARDVACKPHLGPATRAICLRASSERPVSCCRSRRWTRHLALRLAGWLGALDTSSTSRTSHRNIGCAPSYGASSSCMPSCTARRWCCQAPEHGCTLAEMPVLRATIGLLDKNGVLSPYLHNICSLDNIRAGKQSSL